MKTSQNDPDLDRPALSRDFLQLRVYLRSPTKENRKVLKFHSRARRGRHTTRIALGPEWELQVLRYGPKDVERLVVREDSLPPRGVIFQG
jgi:hypothetical protein